MSNTRVLASISLVGAPLLMLLADGCSFIFGEESFWFVTIVLFLSFYAYVGAIHGLYQLCNGTRLALVGALIAVFGAMVGETIMGLERVGWAMKEVGLQEQIESTVYHPVVFATSRQIGLAFPIGLILLAIALYRSRALSMASTAILIIGIILFPIGRIILGPVANVPGDLIMLIILGKLGMDLYRDNRS